MPPQPVTPSVMGGDLTSANGRKGKKRRKGRETMRGVVVARWGVGGQITVS
jgi:hypothetical protein